MGQSGFVHVVTALTLAVAGCATTTAGMGGGDLHAQGRPEVPVLFDWTSTDGGINGNMVATLPHATFTGPFVQITQETRREALLPLLTGWNEGWNGGPCWSRQRWACTTLSGSPASSGKIVANLRDVGGRSMSRRFISTIQREACPAAGWANASSPAAAASTPSSTAVDLRI